MSGTINMLLRGYNPATVQDVQSQMAHVQGQNLQNQQYGLQNQAAQQQQNALAQLQTLFGQPGALDASGNPTPDTLRQAYAIDPNMGVQMAHNMLVNQQEQLRMRALGGEISKDQEAVKAEAYQHGLTAHDDVLQRTGNEEQAQAAGQKAYMDFIRDAAQGGRFPPDQLQSMPAFDVTTARAWTLKPAQEEKPEQGKPYIPKSDPTDPSKVVYLHPGPSGTMLDSQNRQVNIDDYLPYSEAQLANQLTPPKPYMLKGQEGGDPTSLVYDRLKRQWYRYGPDNELIPVDYDKYRAATKDDVVPPEELYSPETVHRMVIQYLGPVGGAGDPQQVLHDIQASGFGSRAKARNAAAIMQGITDELNARGAQPSAILEAKLRMKEATIQTDVLGRRIAVVGPALKELVGKTGDGSDGFIGQVLKTSEAVPRTGFVPLNKLGNAIQLAGGGKNILDFQIALQGFQNAYAILLGRGNTQTTVFAMQRAQEILHDAFTKGQIKSGIDQLMVEAKIAHDAPAADFQDVLDLAAGQQQEAKTGTIEPAVPGSGYNNAQKAQIRQNLIDALTGEKDPARRAALIERAKSHGADVSGLQ